MDKIKAAVIGLGYFANAVHLPALSRNGDVEIVAVCDRDESRVADAVRAYGFKKTYTDYREMLKKETLDAAYVIVHVSATLEVASATMEARIPTMLEKPPGRTSAETRKLIEVADRTGTINVVAFNRRHAPPVRRAKDLLAGRAVRTASARMLRFHRYESEFVVGTGIHAIDCLRFLAGDVEEVETASASATDDGRGTNLVTMFHYESGAVGQLTVQTVCGLTLEDYEVHAEDASVFVTMPQGGFDDSAGKVEAWFGPKYPLKSLNSDVPSVYRGPGMMDGVYDEEMELVECIRSGRKSPNDVHDGLKTMLLAEAVAKGGRRKVERP